jgi:hypothetical protein
VIGPLAPLTGWPPASNCMDTLIAKRAPSGKNSCCSVILLSLGTRLERGAAGA